MAINAANKDILLIKKGTLTIQFQRLVIYYLCNFEGAFQVCRELFIMEVSNIDFSVGNPRLAFGAAAKHACTISDQDMASYLHYSDSLIGQFLWNTPPFFDKMRIKEPGMSGIGLHSLAITHGTTQGYNLVLRTIKNKFQEFRRLTKKQNLRPVILIPTPTYGFFTPQPRDLGFEIQYIKRDIRNGWKLDPHDVAQALEDIRNSKDRMAAAFFDSNPNNPTGLVRGMRETKKLTNIFVEHNQLMWAREPKKGYYWERGISPDMRAIDDMVYYGLEYNSKQRATSFMIDRRMYKHTYVLLGTSKIGLPALRGGLVVCNGNDAKEINLAVTEECYHPNISSMRAVQYAFSGAPEETKQRNLHLRRLRKAHQYGELLLRSLIEGTTYERLQTRDGQRMLDDTAKVVGNHFDAAHILTDGVKGFKIVTKPQSGFFHLARLQEDAPPMYGRRGHVQTIKNDEDLMRLLDERGVHVCPGQWCKADPNDKLVRLSYGLAPEDIVRGVVGIRTAFQNPRQSIFAVA